MSQAQQPLHEPFDTHLDYREICEHLYDGIHITDGEGRILFINEAYVRTTGLKREELIGKRVQEIEGKLYRGSVTMKVLEERKRVNSMAVIFELDKEVLVTGTPVFDAQGNIKLVVTNTRDFPELRQLGKQLQALEEESRKNNEELLYLRRKQGGNKRIRYRSESMRNVMDLVHTVAPTDVSVLITGESGTGKELIASEIYQTSNRKDKPFIKVNCAAIPGELLESELFGYEEGAFTGAKRGGKSGLFELANDGIILLDEIGDMPLALQVKLLRVLQQREFMRVGGVKSIALNVRVIAATNKDLLDEIRKGRFRADLYYRLNVVPIEIQPLRERKEDIPELVNQFCSDFNEKYGKHTVVSPGGLDLLTQYSWPGNIRELENLIERMIVTCPDSVIRRSQVFTALNHQEAQFAFPFQEESTSLKQQLQRYERELVLQAVEQEGSLRKAAKLLGVDHSTLVKKYKVWFPNAQT